MVPVSLSVSLLSEVTSLALAYGDGTSIPSSLSLALPLSLALLMSSRDALHLPPLARISCLCSCNTDTGTDATLLSSPWVTTSSVLLGSTIRGRYLLLLSPDASDNTALAIAFTGASPEGTDLPHALLLTPGDCFLLCMRISFAASALHFLVSTCRPSFNFLISSAPV